MFWYFAKEHLLTTFKTKRMMGASTVEIVRLMSPKNEKRTLCIRYGVPSETEFLTFGPSALTYDAYLLPVNERIIGASIEFGKKR